MTAHFAFLAAPSNWVFYTKGAFTLGGFAARRNSAVGSSALSLMALRTRRSRLCRPRGGAVSSEALAANRGGAAAGQERKPFTPVSH